MVLYVYWNGEKFTSWDSSYIPGPQTILIFSTTKQKTSFLTHSKKIPEFEHWPSNKNLGHGGIYLPTAIPMVDPLGQCSPARPT